MRMKILGCMLASWACLYAQDSLHTQHLQSVEVRARKPHNAASTTSPIQQLSHEDFELLGITSVGDAARRMAGVSVRDYGGIGGMQTVSVRSLGACHTAVSYDGIVLSNMQAGQIDVSRYSLENIAQLSMAIGQNSDLMQSARHYASAGLLCIETQSPFDLGKASPLDLGKASAHRLRASVRTGSWGLLQPSLRYTHLLDGQTAISLDANMLRADGVYPFTIRNGRNTEHHRRYNSDVLSGQGEVNLYHRWGKMGESADGDYRSCLSTKVGYYNSKRGLPGVVVLYNPDTRERMWDENFFAQAVIKTQLAPRISLKARMKYAHSWTEYEDYDVKYQDGKLTDVDRQDEYYLSATLGYDIARHWRIALAEDLTLGTLRNNIASQPNPTRFSEQAALSLRWQQDRVQMDANVVGTYIAEHASNPADDEGNKVKARIPADRKRLSPSIAFSYRLMENEVLYARAMMKSTYRVPTFTDMYYLRIGNTHLRPENATEWNLGLTWAHGFGRVSGAGRMFNVQATVDGYYNRVSDKIVAFPSTYVWKMVNFGKVDILGLDATLSLDMRLGREMSLVMDATYTYQHAVDKTDATKSYYDQQLPYTPRHTAHVSMGWKSKWIDLGWQMQMVGERWSMIQGTDEYFMPRYQEHSFTLSRAWRMLSVSISLLNAFNKQYEVIKYYPMPGRNWQAKMIVTL